MLRRTLGTAIALTLLAACGGERPLVERFESGAWEARPYRVASLTGARDGTALSFALRLEGAPNIRVHATLEIDPRPRLVEGRWVEESGSGTGPVTAAAVDFFGGQGGQPSLRGQITLSSTRGPLYRVNLPTTAMDRGEGQGR